MQTGRTPDTPAVIRSRLKHSHRASTFGLIGMGQMEAPLTYDYAFPQRDADRGPDGASLVN